MGVHISLERRNGERVEGWDVGRMAGDRELAKLIPTLPHVCENRAMPPDFEYYFRPSDFDAWRKVQTEHDWPNPDRVKQLIDILEADPDVWISISS